MTKLVRQNGQNLILVAFVMLQELLRKLDSVVDDRGVGVQVTAF